MSERHIGYESHPLYRLSTIIYDSLHVQFSTQKHYKIERHNAISVPYNVKTQDNCGIVALAYAASLSVCITCTYKTPCSVIHLKMECNTFPLTGMYLYDVCFISIDYVHNIQDITQNIADTL